MSYTQEVSGWISTLDPASPTATLIARLLRLTRHVHDWDGLRPLSCIPAVAFTVIGNTIVNLHRRSGYLSPSKLSEYAKTLNSIATRLELQTSVPSYAQLAQEIGSWKAPDPLSVLSCLRLEYLNSMYNSQSNAHTLMPTSATSEA
jgi:hypothetical protein